MTTDSGIIDHERNPFTTPDWIRQNLSFTPYRQRLFHNLIGKDEKSIRVIVRNNGKYPAFVAIRWGFAKMLDGILCTTEKWDNIEKYNQKGNLMVK